MEKGGGGGCGAIVLDGIRRKSGMAPGTKELKGLLLMGFTLHPSAGGSEGSPAPRSARCGRTSVCNTLTLAWLNMKAVGLVRDTPQVPTCRP